MDELGRSGSDGVRAEDPAAACLSEDLHESLRLADDVADRADVPVVLAVHLEAEALVARLFLGQHHARDRRRETDEVGDHTVVEGASPPRNALPATMVPCLVATGESW